MPGRRRARRLVSTAGGSSRLIGSWAFAGAAGLALLASANNCGFPEYDFHPGGGAGATSGGALSGGPNGGSSADAGAPDTDGGGGTAPIAGSDAGGADGGAVGAAGAACEYPKPVIYSDRCFDHTQNGSESGVDCGGGECSACAGTQTCVNNDDCLSGKCGTDKTCTAVFLAQYTSIVGDAFVRSPKFRLLLTYQDPESTTLDLIRVRYYFNHNGVSEPVLGLNSQATLTTGNAQITIPVEKIHAQVYRTVLGPGAPVTKLKTDSYLEISFKSPTSVLPGTQLDITQDFWAGSSETPFDQNSHYSFFNGTNANETVTVYRDGKRVWGIEPPWVELPECAYAGGVNLNGNALTVSGEPLTAASEAQLTFRGGGDYANAAANALPTADADTTQLLTTARTLSGTATANWSVPNGKYYVFAWLTSAANSDSGTLTIQDNPADKFIGFQKDSAAAWGLLGPYPVTVNEQTLGLAVSSGFVHVAGLKLYRAE